jgi:hypothetical protein
MRQKIEYMNVKVASTVDKRNNVKKENQIEQNRRMKKWNNDWNRQKTI